MRRLFFFVNLLVIPLLSCWVVYRRLATPPADVVAVPGPFDYFKLALQWPPSICSGDPRCPSDFTIHGLWPQNFSAYLRNCDDSSTYVTIRGPLLQRMQSNWPDVVNLDDTKQGFWRIQWMTHGTCSLFLYNQDKYFPLALDWKDQYDFLGHFHRQGITPGPSSHYKFSLINEAVTNLTSKIPDLLCDPRAGQTLTLREVRFCFDPSGTEVIDCPDNYCSKSCIGEKDPDIYFPAEKHPFHFRLDG